LEDPDPAFQIAVMDALQQITGRDLGYDINAWQEHFSAQAETPGQ
jgi:hypothetical protein